MCLVGLYVDGREIAARNGAYPKPSPPPTSYHFGHDPFDEELSDEDQDSRWSMASCHLIAIPLQPELVILSHRLGPRYQGNFQDGSLFRFLTYQMYTSINVHLFGWQGRANSHGPDYKDGSAILSKGLTGDFGFDESQVIISLNPSGMMEDPEQAEASGIRVVGNTGSWHAGKDTYATVVGDVVCSRAKPLDLAVWRAGGPAIALELIKFSTVCCFIPDEFIF